MRKAINSLGILTSWNLHKCDGHYYIASTHYSYLQYASTHFSNVYLISSIRNNDNIGDLLPLKDLANIKVVELPAVNSYLGAIANFKSYIKAINSTKRLVDAFYCRVPDPFCWLPKLLSSRPCIMHYVGDTIDATWHNEQWSLFKKIIMISGYFPDYLSTLIASKFSTVYTNGPHIQKKLSKLGIKATSVISSTIRTDELKPLGLFRASIPPTFVYIGYLRYAKGINLLMDLWVELKQRWPNFLFNLVGDGEMTPQIEAFIEKHDLKDNVICYGYVGDREKMKSILRESDLFVFPSLSEGSPRVVIEAMAEGTPVVSTPVGSLPSTFVDKESIRFFDFNDLASLMNVINDYSSNPTSFDKIRKNAYQLVKNNYTQDSFLSTIYSPIR